MSTVYDETSMPDRVLNIAHRGASGHAPENTMAAFELALEQGADVLELDVARSRDGHVVVHHDETLERTTDVTSRFPERSPWQVGDFSLDELQELSAGTYDGRHQHVPALADVLRLARDRDAGVLIDVKGHARDAEILHALVEELNALSDRQWVSSRVGVSAFELDTLLAVRELLPDVRLAFILHALITDPDGRVLQVHPPGGLPGIASGQSTYSDVRDILAHHAIAFLGLGMLSTDGEPSGHFTRDDVEHMRERGVELNLFANEAEVMYAYLQRGVSSILTDLPNRLASVIQRSAPGQAS